LEFVQLRLVFIRRKTGVPGVGVLSSATTFFEFFSRSARARLVASDFHDPSGIAFWVNFAIHIDPSPLFTAKYRSFAANHLLAVFLEAHNEFDRTGFISLVALNGVKNIETEPLHRIERAFNRRAIDAIPLFPGTGVYNVIEIAPHKRRVTGPHQRRGGGRRRVA
jgi:hypothetical protein